MKQGCVDKFKRAISKHDISKRPPRIRMVQEETEEIQKIKEAIPLINDLHQSWDCIEHIGWQILRLNQAYRESVTKYYQYKLRLKRIVFQNQDFHSYPLFIDYLPFPQEPFDDYERRVIAWVEENIRNQAGLFRGVKIDRNDPIPHSIRFPCPLIRPLLPIHKFKLLMTHKGRPSKNWSRNLLVYELSLAGMRNAEIGRLLFQMESSRFSKGNPKHPILVKIAKIKRSIEKIVSQSYPLD